MKKLLSIAAVAALVLTGCSKDLKVTPAEKLTIEFQCKESWKSDLEGHIY